MEQFAALHEKTETVIRPVQAVSEDIFIRTVRPRRIVNCLIAPPRNILTYLLTYLQLAVKPDIGSESRFLLTPPAFDVPVRRVPVGILPRVWYGRTRMMWLPGGEKNLTIALFVLT